MSKKSNENKRFFLLGFFEVDKNEAKELNGFILFKHWDGNKNRWTVDIFTKESYEAMRSRKSAKIQEESLF